MARKNTPLIDTGSKENLSIEVTTECNSMCTHCFARAGLEKRASLSPEAAYEIIKEGFDLGYRNLHITGGEPLLWDSFFSLLDSSLNMGYESVFFNTNGMLLSEEKCRNLSSYRDNIIFSVSIQGLSLLHDKVRGKGSWDHAVNGIRNAFDSDLKLMIFTTVGKSLLPDLHHYVDFIYKEFKGIDHLTLIQVIRVNGDVFDLSSELLTPEDFIRMVKVVSLLNLYGLEVDILENPLATVVSNILNMTWIPQAHPLFRSGRIIVMANKQITLSHSSRETFGTYKPGMLETVLKSERYRNAVSPDDVTCPSCCYHDKCLEFDMNHPSEWYRDMHPERPYCQRVLERVQKESGD